MLDVGLWAGVAFVFVGLAAVVLALPVTHALAQRMPQWTFSRGDVDRLGSTTFLMASVGLLLVCAGIALVYRAVVGA